MDHMKIIIAPQAFKGSLTAEEAARAMQTGVKAAGPAIETVFLPISDGGSGTVRALVEATSGKLMQTAVTGPLEEKVTAVWGILGDGKTAAIEMSAASGLALVPAGRLDPMKATTFGTGELILAALDAGCKSIIIGLGDSATVDGGAGMAEALGIRLLDEKDRPIPCGGGGLAALHHIDFSGRDSRIAGVRISGACDVTNPLCGTQGAAAVYGPQKGATADMVAVLDANLRHLSEIIEKETGDNIRELPGSGAAGGLGAGLVAFLGAELKSGIDLVLGAIRFDEHLSGADLVITGEGRIDFQTAFGKTAVGIARRAQQRQVPVLALCGALGDGYQKLYECGISAMASILPRCMDPDGAMKDAFQLLADAAERSVRLFRAGRNQ